MELSASFAAVKPCGAAERGAGANSLAISWFKCEAALVKSGTVHLAGAATGGSTRSVPPDPSLEIEKLAVT